MTREAGSGTDEREDDVVREPWRAVFDREGDVALVEAVHRGEDPAQAGRGQDHELLAVEGRESIDQAEVERAVERGRAGDVQLREAGAGVRAADLDVERAAGAPGCNCR